MALTTHPHTAPRLKKEPTHTNAPFLGLLGRNLPLYACLYMCVCMYICVCMYVCLCMYVCVYVRMYVCVYIYIYIHTHTHTHTHTHEFSFGSLQRTSFHQTNRPCRLHSEKIMSILRLRGTHKQLLWTKCQVFGVKPGSKDSFHSR